MSENPYNTKKFKQLFNKWNKRLEMLGHKEIEDFNYELPTRTEQTKYNFDRPVRHEQFIKNQRRASLHLHLSESEIDSNSIPLKRWDALTFRSMDPDLFAAKQEYFRRAEAVLGTFNFESKLHEQVWAFHSQGYSIREIAALVKKRSKSPIHNIIKKIQKKVGLRE